MQTALCVFRSLSHPLSLSSSLSLILSLSLSLARSLSLILSLTISLPLSHSYSLPFHHTLSHSPPSTIADTPLCRYGQSNSSSLSGCSGPTRYPGIVDFHTTAARAREHLQTQIFERERIPYSKHCCALRSRSTLEDQLSALGVRKNAFKLLRLLVLLFFTLHLFRSCVNLSRRLGGALWGSVKWHSHAH